MPSHSLTSLLIVFRHFYGFLNDPVRLIQNWKRKKNDWNFRPQLNEAKSVWLDLTYTLIAPFSDWLVHLTLDCCCLLWLTTVVRRAFCCTQTPYHFHSHFQSAMKKKICIRHGMAWHGIYIISIYLALITRKTFTWIGTTRWTFWHRTAICHFWWATRTRKPFWANLWLNMFTYPTESSNVAWKWMPKCKV